MLAIGIFGITSTEILRNEIHNLKMNSSFSLKLYNLSSPFHIIVKV